jgi:hypothetical protein
MKTKEVTLCEQKVTIAYCVATEIIYKELAEEEIHEYIQELSTAIKENKNIEIRKAIYFIYAAMQAYYDSVDKKCPFSAKYLISNMSPSELMKVVGEILILFTSFYKISDDKEEKKEETEKNV